LKPTDDQLLASIGLDGLEGWDPVPLMFNGEHIGTLIVRGMEVHFAFTKIPQSSIRRAARQMLAPVLDKFGMLTTRVPKGMLASEKFVRRVGFKKTWHDDTYDYYMLTTLPWERKAKET
jgi:hypothetical protein